MVKRGYESELVIEDAGYSDQGEYTCRAINEVGGERREATSEVIRLQVSGVPQVVKQVLPGFEFPYQSSPKCSHRSVMLLESTAGMFALRRSSAVRLYR